MRGRVIAFASWAATAIVLWLSVFICVSTSVAETCEPPDYGLISWWQGEGNAADARDGNHGTPQNGVGFAAGKVGQAFSFDGTDDHIIVADAPNLNPLDQITVAAWYRTESFYGNGNNSVVDKGYTSHDPPFYQYRLGVGGNLRLSGRASFRFAVSVDGVRMSATTGVDFWEPDQWYHLVGTYDGTAVRLYVDGVLIDSILASGSMTAYGRPIYIAACGNLPVDSVHALPGLVDEIAIYGCALDAGQVHDLYVSGRPDWVIPTLTEYGLTVFGMLLLLSVAWYIRRRRMGADPRPL